MTWYNYHYQVKIYQNLLIASNFVFCNLQHCQVQFCKICCFCTFFPTFWDVYCSCKNLWQLKQLCYFHIVHFLGCFDISIALNCKFTTFKENVFSSNFVFFVHFQTYFNMASTNTKYKFTTFEANLLFSSNIDNFEHFRTFST